MNPIKIAFSGKMRSGKDTACRIIKDISGRNGLFVWHGSLAAPMKELCRDGLGMSDRKTLQTFGTDIIRKGCREHFGHEDFWVNLFLAKSLEAERHNDILLCSDVRFPNEVWGLQRNGFFVVRLEVTQEQQLARPGDGKETTGHDHPSEVAIDVYGANNLPFYRIIPACEIGDLRKSVGEVFIELLERGDS